MKFLFPVTQGNGHTIPVSHPNFLLSYLFNSVSLVEYLTLIFMSDIRKSWHSLDSSVDFVRKKNFCSVFWLRFLLDTIQCVLQSSFPVGSCVWRTGYRVVETNDHSTSSVEQRELSTTWNYFCVFFQCTSTKKGLTTTMVKPKINLSPSFWY